MKNMFTSVVAVSMLVTGAASAQPGLSFPATAPESVGMKREALEALDAAVKGYIDRQEAVGAELMVIKDRKTVWHTAHGLRDVETKAPMEIGGIFCVRSQTKPLVGTAVQMLIDEGKISLDDHAAKFLPEFDSDSHRTITVKNLLEHRSGLSLSSLLGVDHKTLTGVKDVAGLAAKSKLEFEPGAEFNYSDDGTDTLAAIVEKVSGVPAAEFIESRIIKPIGMGDTMCVLKKGDPRYARVNSNHGGSAGAWSRFWSASDDPLFPYFLGSQSLYSTCEDYAKFLCLWADGGKVGDSRVLSGAAVERGLAPTSEMQYPTGFQGLEVRYAQLWMTWIKPDAPSARVVFGHGGSDGTAAWMWPARNLIVLYFTQSRGGTTVVTIEKEIDRLLILGEDPAVHAAPAANLAGLEGVYWDGDKGRSWALTQTAERLHVEIQGTTVMDLIAAEEGAWKFEMEPGPRVRFQTGANGVATGLEVTAGDKVRKMTRVVESPDLPSAAKVEAMVREAHGLGRVNAVIRREGTIKMPTIGIDSAYVELIGRDKSLIDFEARGVRTRVLVRDGKAWARQGTAPAEELTGSRASQSLFQRSQVIFGGWSDAGAKVQVLKRVEEEGRPLLVVRLVPREGHSCVLYIEESKGRVVKQDQLVTIPGLGAAVGLKLRYEDFEDVGGVGGPVLPRASRSEYVTPLLGKGETKFEKQGVVEEGDGVFVIDGD